MTTTGQFEVQTNSDTGFEFTNNQTSEVCYKFSPSGTKLYYCVGGGGWSNSKPYQIDLTTGKQTQLSTDNFSGPKLAPNGKIYWTVYPKASLAVVENPNGAGQDAKFDPYGLTPGSGITASWNLPTQTFSLRRD